MASYKPNADTALTSTEILLLRRYCMAQNTGYYFMVYTMSIKRIHHDQSHWQQLVEQQAKSGLSGASFCRQQDIRYANFMSWRKKLQTLKTISEPCVQSAFIELTAPAHVASVAPRQQDSQSESTLCVELSLGSGIELRITRHD